MNTYRLNPTMVNLRIKLTCFAFCCLFAVGCGDPDRKRLVGKWKLDQASRVEDRITDSNFADASKMTLAFWGNGSLETTTQMGGIDGKKKGSWEMLSFDPEQKIMKLKCTLGMQTTEHQIEFLSDTRIKLAPPNMAGLSLKLEFERD